MQKLSAELSGIVDANEPLLRMKSEEDSVRPALPGGWSPKQVMGHLIDSASNNHQRFVRAALADSLTFPAYDQNGSVRVQDPDSAAWSLLVDFWASYNRYLAHVIARLPASKLGIICHIGANEPVTLQYLAEDYVRHMVHHLNQITA